MSVSHGRSIKKAHRKTCRCEMHCGCGLTLFDPGYDIAVEKPKDQEAKDLQDAGHHAPDQDIEQLMEF